MLINRFIVIVPVYNAEAYIEQCLKSILNQDYANYELIVMDDCSTDSTYQLINKVHNEYNNKFTICRNNYRLKSPLTNIAKAIELFSHDKEDIIITIDGDDYLNGTDVFSYINNVYQDPLIYMTYGQFTPLSKSYGPFCKYIDDHQQYRKSGAWQASHLRTFKNKLWYKINDTDLRDKDGSYFKIASDAAYLYPLLEMCGHKHCKFIEKVLYIYNDTSPYNDMKVHLKEQLDTAEYIRSKPVYTELVENI